jgi:hypothetical protein
MDNNHFWNIVRVLPTDYHDYGGKIERFSHPEEFYPDCINCRFFKKIDNEGWGICSNPNSPRSGLLTYEHQAGFDCFNK